MPIYLQCEMVTIAKLLNKLHIIRKFQREELVPIAFVELGLKLVIPLKCLTFSCVKIMWYIMEMLMLKQH